MKLIFAVLDVSVTMGLTRCYKTEGFFTFIKYKGPILWNSILPSIRSLTNINQFKRYI